MKGSLVWLLVGTVVMSSIAGGCKSRKHKRRVHTIEGTVAEIDRANSRVVMRFFHKKQGRQMTREGRVTKDTEILIDGKLSTLDDVREGDYAHVTLYVQGTDIVAERVAIERLTPGQDTSPTTAPATMPALDADES